MTHPHEDLLREWLAAGDAGELERFAEFLHEDVVVHAPLGLSTSSIEDEQEVWRRGLAAMSNLRHDVQETFVNGESVAARVVVTGSLSGEFGGIVSSGRSFTTDQAIVMHLRDGKASEVWEIVDSAAIRQQVSDDRTGSAGR